MSIANIAVRRQSAARRRRPGRIGRLFTRGCLVVVGVAVLVAIFGPLLVGDPNASDLSNAYGGPSGSHLLGFDSQGRDLITRLIVGARPSLLAAGLVATLSVATGTVLSLFAAWFGGRVDTVINTFCNVVFGFPGLLLAIVAAAVIGSGLTAAIGALTIAYVPFVVRILRSGIRQERNREYVAAASILGLPTATIWARHLLPNVTAMIAAQLTLMFGYATVDLATISFLGLGVQPPNADWGVMVANGKSGILAGYPQEAIYAGLCLIVVVVAVNLLGQRLAAEDQR